MNKFATQTEMSFFNYYFPELIQLPFIFVFKPTKVIALH